jgi:general stress protein 26
MDKLEKEKEKAAELIRDFRSGMLTTLGMHDGPHARPMMIAGVDDDLMMTFVTSLDSLKVDEIRRRGTVGVTLQSKGAFVAISGYATIVTDEEQKRADWHPVASLWFQGADDPEAALVKFQPETIEYWDQRGLNSLRFAFEAVRAVATGNEPQESPKIHGQVAL